MKLFINNWNRYIFHRKLWVFKILIFYILLKCISNSEPLVKVSNAGISFGIFNFHKTKPIQSNQNEIVYFNWNPIQMISPYQINISHHNPCPPGYINSENFFHVLGTDILGRDCLSGLIAGFEISILLATLVGIGTCFISVFLGSWFAILRKLPFYFTKLQILILLLFLFVLMLHISWQFLGIITTEFQHICFCIYLIFGLFFIIFSKKKIIILPIHNFGKLIFDFFQSIPDLILIVLLSSLFAGIGWVGFVFMLILIKIPNSIWVFQSNLERYVSDSFVENAITTGQNRMRIVFKYLIPSTSALLKLNIALVGGSAILTEATLSFLGIGPTTIYITWGKMLQMGIQNLRAWWLLCLPLLSLICLTVLIQNILKTKKEHEPN